MPYFPSIQFINPVIQYRPNGNATPSVGSNLLILLTTSLTVLLSNREEGC